MKNWINGALTSDGGRAIEVINPATLDVVDTVENCGDELLDQAVAAARSAQPAWAADEPARRAALLKASRLLADHREELTTLLSREQGKPLWQAARELQGNENMARWYADMVVEDESLRDTAEQSIVARRRPIGVVGIITPWNFPVAILGMKLWATLLMGNTIVLKPATSTPLTTLRIAEILGGALPAGVLNTITGEGGLGSKITRHPGIDKISFTGSTQTGRAVMTDAGESLKRLTLELGGNDPAILLDEVDIAEVAPMLVRGAFHNAGQVCQAIKRVFVPRHLADDLVTHMLHEANEYMVLGCGQDPEVTVGPVNNAQQQQIVEELIADAVQQGGTVHELGTLKNQDLPGHFVRPVLVTGLKATDRLVAEEQFGPALPVVVYDDLERLVEQLNAEEYGLDASVWSSDEERAVDVASRLRVGQAFVNSHAGPPDPSIPFGGVKASGFGRELGVRGLDDVSELQVLSVTKTKVKVS